MRIGIGFEADRVRGVALARAGRRWRVTAVAEEPVSPPLSDPWRAPHLEGVASAVAALAPRVEGGRARVGVALPAEGAWLQAAPPRAVAGLNGAEASWLASLLPCPPADAVWREAPPCVVAAPRPWLEGVTRALERQGWRVRRLEPALAALARLAPEGEDGVLHVGRAVTTAGLLHRGVVQQAAEVWQAPPPSCRLDLPPAALLADPQALGLVEAAEPAVRGALRGLEAVMRACLERAGPNGARPTPPVWWLAGDTAGLPGFAAVAGEAAGQTVRDLPPPPALEGWPEARGAWPAFAPAVAAAMMA